MNFALYETVCTAEVKRKQEKREENKRGEYGIAGNKREVDWDAFIARRGRYVGIASRGSLSRTANCGIMHTAGPVPQL